MPPRVVRFHETCGLALSAIVAIVPCGACPPPGVSVGVAVSARRATDWTYPVNRITGRPSAITMSAPGSTQVGSPIVTVAALAIAATAITDTTYASSARRNAAGPCMSTEGIACMPPPLVTPFSAAITSAALCGRASASFARQRMTRSFSSAAARRAGARRSARGASPMCAARMRAGVRP